MEVNNQEVLLLDEKCKRGKYGFIYIGYKHVKPENGEQKTNTKKYLSKDGELKSRKIVSNNIEYDDDIYYCMHCKKVVKAKHQKINEYYKDIFGNTSISVLNSNNYNIVCPICGQTTNPTYVYNLNTEYLINLNYFVDNNKIKIVRKTLMFKFYNNNIIVNNYHYREVINMDSGYTYKLPVFKNGKKIKDSNIINSTYHTDDYRYYGIYDKIKTKTNLRNEEQRNSFYINIYNEIRNYKIKKNNFYISTFEEQKENSVIKLKDYSLDLPLIKFFNRFPAINIFESLELFSNKIYNLPVYFDQKEKNKFYRNRRKIKQDCKDPIKEILSIYKIPITKKNKKEIRKGKSNLLGLYKLYSINLKIDNINKLIDNNLIKSFNIVSFLEYFIKETKIISKKEENNIINKMVKEKKNLIGIFCNIHDIVFMHKTIIKKDKDYKISFKGSFREIHDKLSKDYYEMQHQKVEYKYTEEELKIEGNFNSFNFVLGKDNHELNNVGSTMRICVGTYHNKVMSNRCKIVIAYNEKNEPKICIELTPNFHRIVQAKLFANKGIEENSEEFKAITQWIEANNLYVNTYSDIPQSYKEINNKEVNYFLEGETGEVEKVGLCGNVIN
jgi:hypothetical protein